MARAVGGLVLAACFCLSSESFTGAESQASIPVAGVVRIGGDGAGHEKDISSVAFSPGGELLASGSHDKSIRLWDTATGKEFRRLGGHRDWVSCVSFSADGKLLASCSRDWTVKLWEVATGKELRQFNGHAGGVLAVTISPDGKLLASAGQDKTIRLWDIATGREARQFLGHEAWVTGIAWAPDGKSLASGSWDGTVRVWEIATGKERKRWGKSHGRFHAIALSPDGRVLVGASQSKGVVRWDTLTGQELSPLPMERHRALTLAFARNGETLASAGKDGTIRIWEPAPGREYCPIGEQFHRAACLAFTPDGKRLATGSTNSTILIWDVAGQVYAPEPHGKSLTAARLQRLWEDLTAQDALVARRSMAELARAPGQSVPFFKEQLPALAVDARRIERLIRELEDSQFAVRQKATDELENLGQFAESAMQKAMQEKPPLETRQRLQRLLDKLEPGKLVPYPDPARARRALQVLEQIDNAEARRHLQILAAGAPESWLTHEAKSVRERMALRPRTTP